MTAAAVLPPVTGGVLVASPSSQVRSQMLNRLDPGHRPVYEVSGGAEALAKLDGGNWQMLILDRQLPDLDAEELAQITERLYPGIQVVLVDSRADADTEHGLGNRGEKSEWGDTRFHSARQSVNRPAIIPRHSEKNQVEKNQVEKSNDAPLPEMIGDTEPMRRVYRMVRLVAQRNTTVLITGPTGSGKELVAWAIHQLSGRSGNAFSVLNCAAIPEGLIESELFGYVRGAFTGAAQTYAGRILAAQGGTLFLDEIGELPLNAQSKLLRFLEQKEVQRLGSAETTRVDVRVVAATNLDLTAAVERGAFRADLFFRLCAFPIGLAPLAERAADVLKLTVFFLKRLADRGPALRVDAQAQQMLDAHSWPGNVRELEQVLERAAILAGDGHMILPEHLVFSFPGKSAVARKVS